MEGLVTSDYSHLALRNAYGVLLSYDGVRSVVPDEIYEWSIEKEGVQRLNNQVLFVILHLLGLKT